MRAEKRRPDPAIRRNSKRKSEGLTPSLRLVAPLHLLDEYDAVDDAGPVGLHFGVAKELRGEGVVQPAGAGGRVAEVEEGDLERRAGEEIFQRVVAGGERRGRFGEVSRGLTCVRQEGERV